MKFADIDNIDIIHVCTSCHCADDWGCCGYAGICPHSPIDDGEFSINAYNACVEIESGAKVKDAAKEHHISIMKLLKYKRTVENDIKEVQIQFPDCTTKCDICMHYDDCKHGIR